MKHFGSLLEGFYDVALSSKQKELGTIVFCQVNFIIQQEIYSRDSQVS